MIVLAPGSALWDVARHAPWLARVVIDLTQACVVVTLLAVLASWLRPQGVRVIVAVGAGLAVLFAVRGIVSALVYLPRPFVALHFHPLYPHARDTSFPSDTTGYFAVAAVPLWLAWRRIGWLVAAITVEVGFGCTYVGVHYVTDVIGGAAIGALGAGAAWWALGRPPLSIALARAETRLHARHLRPAPPPSTAHRVGR